MSAERAFLCRRCGDCCRGEGRVWLLPSDLDALAAELGLTVAALTERYTRLDDSRRGLILLDAPDGACILLGANNACKVHDAKPFQCRRYPFDWQNPDTVRTCPGLSAPETTVISFDQTSWPLVFELDEGQSMAVPGRGGRPQTVRLIGVRQFTEPDWWVPDNDAHVIVARAEVSVEVDGEPATLHCRPYEMPRVIGGLRLFVEATREWARRPQYQPLTDLARSVRFSCVPAGEPWGPELRFPIAGFRWRCSTYQNTWNALVPYNRLYYHRGEDFGAIPDRLDVVAPTTGRIVKSPLPDGDGHSNTLSLQLDGTDARLAFAHMNVESIPADMVVGKAVAAGEKLGRTGCTWSGRRSQHADPHLHCGLCVADVEVSLYPLIVESYFRTYPDAVLAIAGSYGFTTTGGDYLCDGSRSVARPGRRIVNWRWRLHDGAIVRGPVARATYDRPGAYVEELVVTADDGTEDRDFLHVRAYAPGKIRDIAKGWLYSSPCRGIVPGMPVTLWSRLSNTQAATVDFGDGTAPEPLMSEMTHAYDQPGLYAIAVSGSGPDAETVAMKVRVCVEERE